MADKYITVGGKDHLGDGTPDNLTACGKDIPYGSDWGYVDREGTTNPCPKCFPEAKREAPKVASKAKRSSKAKVATGAQA